MLASRIAPRVHIVTAAGVRAPRGRHAGRRRERGAVLVHVAVAMTGLLAFSALSIDLGALWVSRAQAQNAADAAALAGGVALAYVNPSDLDAAEAAARAIAQAHSVWGEPVGPASLQTLVGACPAGSPAVPGECLRVVVQRSIATGTPLPVFFSRLFGASSAEVLASASAKVLVGNTAPCPRPLAIIDRWNDRHDTSAPIDGAWTDDDFYDGYDITGTPNLPAGGGDAYDRPTASGTGTGITTADMAGLPITRLEFDDAAGLPLRGDALLSLDLARPGFEGDTHEDRINRYEANLGSCSGLPMSIGATPAVFNAHRRRYTVDPLLAVIAMDPGATWDSTRRAVVGSAFNVSPRIITVAVVDPEVISQQDRTAPLDVTAPIRNFVGLFVQSASDRGASAEVTGVIVPMAGGFNTSAPLVSERAAFLRTVALVR